MPTKKRMHVLQSGFALGDSSLGNHASQGKNIFPVDKEVDSATVPQLCEPF